MKEHEKKYEGTFTGSCSGSKICGRPAAYTKKYIAGEELGILLSSEISIEGAKSRAYIGRGSEILLRDEKLGIFLSPKASIEGAKEK